MVDSSYQPIRSEDEIRCRLSDINHIFIHIPKTAGGAVQTWLGDQRATGHVSATRLREILGETKWNSMYKFATIRNPYDRLVSWYHHFRGSIVCPTFEAWIKEDMPVDWADEWHGEGIKNDPLSLTSWICDSEGRLMVNKVCRFETIGRDCADVAGRINRPFKRLEKRNVSIHEVYWNYYDEELRAIVANRFAEELERFHYAF